jgi:hypothetical protein
VNDPGELGPIQDAIAIATLWRGTSRESCQDFARELLTEQGVELVLAQADLLLWALEFAATVINRTLAEGYEPATVEVLLQQLARSAAVDAA